MSDAAFWDALAERYAAKPFPNPDATARKLAITRGLLRNDMHLLDVGCGTGTIALELAPHVAHVHGVDVSAAMVAIADRKRIAASSANVAFSAEPVGDLARFADASFDVVLAYNLVHLVPDPVATLRAFARVLAPGGVFVSSTPCLGGVWLPPYSLILPVMRAFGKAPAVTCIAAADLPRMLGEAGFVDVAAPDVGETATNLFLTARRAG